MHTHLSNIMTSKTLVDRVRADDADALEDLQRRYSAPIRAYLAGILRGYGEVDEERLDDLHDHFVAVKLPTLPGKLRESAERSTETADGKGGEKRGGLRKLIKAALRSACIDDYRYWNRESRKPKDGQVVNMGAVPGGVAAIPEETIQSAEDAYHAKWMVGLLQEIQEEVREICERKCQQTHYLIFEEFYFDPEHKGRTLEEIAKDYDLTRRKAEGHCETVVRHFRVVLEKRFKEELEPGGSADEEIRRMLEILQELLRRREEKSKTTKGGE